MSPKNRKTNQTRRTPKYENRIVPLINLARNPVVIRRFVLTSDGSLGSNGSGVMAGTLSLDPSSSSQWSSLALVYDQFRVLGGCLKLACARPLYDTASNALCRFAFDNDSASTPTSLQDIAGYSEVMDTGTVWTSGTVKKFNFMRPSIRGLPQEGRIWYNETTPGDTPGSVKYYASGLTNSVGYFNYSLDLLVEFQMRGS